MRKLLFLAVGVLGVANLGFGAIIVDKTPDQGPYWNGLGSNGGTAVYADSFVASVSAQLDILGVYIRLNGAGDPSEFQIQLWADAGNSPDPANVLGTTGVLTQPSNLLSLITGNLLAPVNIVAGTRYWIAATTVGLEGIAPYQVGAHTQNSIYNDSGTFWYSNDPAGINFDGTALTPEMAIYAETLDGGSGVPEPATLGMMAVGLSALVAWRKRN